MKIKDDFLSKNPHERLFEYQFIALCQIFSSDTLSTILHKYLTTEEVSKFIEVSSKHVSKLLSQEDLKSSMDFKKIRYKANQINEILKAFSNLIKKYGVSLPISFA